jgi:PST family polysaccharide transporter
MTIPIVFSCALFANEIVRVVLGPKWAGCVLILRLLAPTIFVLAVIDPLDWLLWASGLVGRGLKIGLLITPVVILGVVAGLRHGPPGVALGYSTAMVLLLGPVLAWAKHKTGITTGDYWDCVKRPLLAGIVGASAGWLAGLTLRATLAPIYLLGVELAVSCAVYVGLLLFVMGEKRIYADILRQLFQRQAPAAAKG